MHQYAALCGNGIDSDDLFSAIYHINTLSPL